MDIKVEFSGGLETLFGGKKSLNITLEDGANIKTLIQILTLEHLKERPELFIKGDYNMYVYKFLTNLL